MSKQLIFCVETNKRNNSDWMYLQTTINHLYNIDSTVKLSVVYMDSKNKYQQKSVTSKIESYIKSYGGNESKVIYCFDTDDIYKDSDNLRFLNEVTDYCKSKGYGLIWFCRDIEEVFTGQKVPDDEKQQRANQYIRKHEYERVNMSKLRSNTYNINTSNLLSVLDEHLTRKSQI